MDNFNSTSNNTPQDMSGVSNVLQLGNQNFAKFISAFSYAFPAQAAYSSVLSIAYSSAGGTTVGVGSGAQNSAADYLVAIEVTTASTATGTVYDANAPANVGSSNIMALIPSSGRVTYNYPFIKGLTIQPSSIGSHTVSVYFINQAAYGRHF